MVVEMRAHVPNDKKEDYVLIIGKVKYALRTCAPIRSVVGCV